MAGEGTVALAAGVAAHARVDLHVLLERTLGLETLPAQQTEDSHVRACGTQRGKASGLDTGLLHPARLEPEPSSGQHPGPHPRWQTQRWCRPRDAAGAPAVRLQRWTESTYFLPSWNLKSSGRKTLIKHIRAANESAIVWRSVSKAGYQEGIYKRDFQSLAQEVGHQAGLCEESQ